MTTSKVPFIDGRDQHGRTAWTYFGRAALLFAAGFGLSFLGSAAHLLWLQVGAFCIAAIAVGIGWRGVWLAYQVRRARYWEWLDEQEARNLRALESLRRPPSSSGPL